MFAVVKHMTSFESELLTIPLLVHTCQPLVEVQANTTESDFNVPLVSNRSAAVRELTNPRSHPDMYRSVMRALRPHDSV